MSDREIARLGAYISGFLVGMWFGIALAVAVFFIESEFRP